MDFDYIKDLAIDPHQLDEEWLHQPVLYMRYSEELADIQKRRDKAKERVDVARARADRDIRANPDKYNINKITEAVVSNVIIEHHEYSNALDEYNDIIYDYSIIKAAVMAFDQRKKALEGLVGLYIGSYFAGPKEPRELEPGKRMGDIAVDKASTRQRQALNRKRKA